MEDLILDAMDGASSFNFNLLFRFIGIGLLFFWFFVVVWVWMDSGERSRSWIFRIASVLLVSIFNLLGLFIYLLIRPSDTLENLYWSDLERRYLLYETADLGDCDNCGFHLHPGYNVCPNCSYPLKRPCGNCKLMIERDWVFCPFCSIQQDEVMSDEELIKNAKQLTLEVDSASAQMLRKEPEMRQDNSSKTDEPKEKTEKAEQKSEPNSKYSPKDSDDVIKPTDQEIDEGAKKRNKQIDRSMEADPEKYSKNVGTIEKLGNYIIGGVYTFGKGIHTAALKISGPLRTKPVVKNSSEKANKNQIEQEALQEQQKEETENDSTLKSKKKEKKAKKGGDKNKKQEKKK